MNDIKFNLPVLISIWHVTYKPLPFFGKKNIKHLLATDLVQKGTSFSSDAYEKFKEEKYAYTVPVEMHYDIKENGRELLRNHYMFKKKSWMYPAIEMVDEYYIYLPYTISRQGDNHFLYEEASGMSRKLKKSDEIYKMMIRG